MEPKNRRIRLTVEYDGTDFAGFQLQGKGERTVQGVLEATLCQLSGEAVVRVHGAGRTDAGVHASGQVVHFETAWPVPIKKMARALNGVLPPDVSVRAAAVADSDFHARFSATLRVYRYIIVQRSPPSALLRRFSWQVPYRLDVSAMRQAASALVGTHDFASFGRTAQPGKTTVRRVGQVMLRQRNGALVITVAGNAFLRQMVRSFVGTLYAVGRGALTPDGVAVLREQRDRTLCPPVAPPQGLCLVRVCYEKTESGNENENVFGQAE